MKFGVLILGAGIGAFGVNILTAITIYCLMGAKAIDYGPPPPWLWTWMLATVWLMVLGGLICVAAKLFEKPF